MQIRGDIPPFTPITTSDPQRPDPARPKPKGLRRKLITATLTPTIRKGTNDSQHH
jgi:hypothetical protein